MSFGIDVLWRKRVAREIVSFLEDGSKVLDVGAGTGDLSIAVASEAAKANKKIEICAMDANADMLEVAAGKIGKFDIRLEKGDALNMRYPEGFFDAVVSGFALRNFDDLGSFSSELERVMKKGGVFAAMDMALPENVFQRAFFRLYFKIIRFFGAFVDKESYDWLAYSVEHFDFGRFKSILESKGFRNLKIESLSFNIAHVVFGSK